MLYIGVDLGTSAVKLLLMNAEGKIESVVSKEYPLYFPHPGWSEQKPEDWWSAVLEGLKELTDEIVKMETSEVQEKEIHTIPRLPIDRVFTISGFGTIVTGTLISGIIRKDDILQLYPWNAPCKVRNIQVHGKNVDECSAGQRVAVNLTGIKKEDISRGDVLASPNSMKGTTLLDVKLKILKDSNRIVKNRSQLHLFTGTSEVLCRAILLDRDELKAGEECFAQLRLEQELALRKGDRFVVLLFSDGDHWGR